MTIKHLVIPGGGPVGLKALGALQHLEQNGFWNIADIETIYATSAGAIISVLLCLKFDWETINDYIIKRPWNDAFKLGVDQIFEAYSKKGLFDKNIAEIFYKPFFNARDISLGITLKEFYELSNIEIHLFSLDINNFNLDDLSHLTHPDLPLLTAVQMSSAIPILISPVCVDDKCYVDGGVVCNYPINQCILRAENINEIFGLRNKYIKNDDNIVKEKSTILEYVMNFISKLVNNVSLRVEEQTIPNELIYDAEFMNLSKIQLTLSSKEVRQELIDSGIEAAKAFLLTRENNATDSDEPLLKVEDLTKLATKVEIIDAVVLDSSLEILA
jgi:predicted acylesterase/phospholipase RssA